MPYRAIRKQSLALRYDAVAVTCILSVPFDVTMVLYLPLQIAAVVAFSQTLRRYTSLNHLAQAARAVLQNSGQVSQMLSDLNRVDFGNVQVGVSGTTGLVCMYVCVDMLVLCVGTSVLGVPV